MSLEWKGDEVKDRVTRATKRAIDETTSESVRSAKRMLRPGHGYDYGIMQRSVEMRAARDIPGVGIAGLFGSFNVVYAIYVELGTQPHWIGRPVKIRGVGWRYIGMHPGFTGIPFLRGSADTEFPKLADRIRRNLAA